MVKEANVKSITVLIMQVPCCSGLAQLAQQAVELSGRKIPIVVTVLSVQGNVLQTASLN